MTGTVRQRKSADGTVRWIADVTIDGKRRQASGRTKAEAERRRRELREQLLQEPVVSTAGFTIAQARQLSLQVRWAGKAYERTAAIYSAAAVDFFGAATPLESINATAVEQWRSTLRRQGNMPATINRKVSALKAMLSDAQLHGRIGAMPKLPKQLANGGHKDRVMTDQEREAFCQFFLEIGEPAAADLLVFLLETAARWSEAERLRSGEVDLAKGRATFWQTKSGKPRTVPLTRRAIDALEPHVSAVPGARVWPYDYARFRRLFDRAKDAAGLAGDASLTIHTCRHTCASRLASKGISLVQLMTFGGWSSLGAVQRYLHLSTDALAACVVALEAP
jgi:integrase